MRTRLRQIVVAAVDLAAVEEQIVSELDVELCHRDPGVAAFGLRNALFPIGDQFLEVVSPIEAGTAAGRQIDKRGGDCGYMVLVEVDDLDAAREHIGAAGVRVVWEAKEPGIVGLHVHPTDIGGTILSIDTTDLWGEWRWAGPSWRDHVRSGTVGEVRAVEVRAADPDSTAQRWSAVLGVGRVEDDGRTRVVPLDVGEVRFVPSEGRPEGISAFVLGGSVAREVEIAGTTFRIEPA